MEVNDFEIVLIAVTFYLKYVWQLIFIVLIENEKTNMIGTGG